MNERMPDKVRVLAFCWMVESYSWLTHTSFQANLRRLEAAFNFKMNALPDIMNVLKAGSQLRLERQIFLDACERYRAFRRHEKAQGIRKHPKVNGDPRLGYP